MFTCSSVHFGTAYDQHDPAMFGGDLDSGDRSHQVKAGNVNDR
jgi:hypothetical protein